jgi:hypothetical protein
MHNPSSFLAVDYLWTAEDNYRFSCVQKVYNSLFVHLRKITARTCTQVIQRQCTAVMNTLFILFTSFRHVLYTVSTQPIITIYLYKGDYKL